MYEEEEFNGTTYTKYPPIHGKVVYIQADLERVTREGLYAFLSGLEREEFLGYIGSNPRHHFKRGEEDPKWYEMMYKSGSTAVVLVHRSQG